jgi:hypothetical protein
VALTITQLGTAVFTTAAGNKTITATPAVGDLIVIIAATSGLAGGTTAVSDNQTPAGAYTQISSDFTGFSTTGVLTAWVRNGLIGAASSTIFTASQAASSGGGLVIFQCVGASICGLGAIRGAGGQSSGGVGATPAPVLLGRVGTVFSGTQAALTTNGMVGAVANGTSPAALTPPASYTEDPTPDLGYTVPTTGLETVRRNSGETNSTITWGGTSATAFASIAIEIDASVPLYDWVVPGVKSDREMFMQGAVGRGANW